jgi:peptidyl-tRNA hydrolase
MYLVTVMKKRYSTCLEEVIVTHDDADCDRFGFASVSFPGNERIHNTS